MHDVFHVSHFEPAATDPFPGQTPPPPPPVEVDDEPEEYFVEAILDSKLDRGKLKYYVKWIGYDQPTWEPANDSINELTAVDSFHALYPTKPGPATPVQAVKKKTRQPSKTLKPSAPAKRKQPTRRAKA